MKKHCITFFYKKNKYIVVALAILCACPVFAETAEPDSVRRVRNLEEVNVTARYDKRASSTAPMYSVSDAKYNVMGVTDISDAIHRLPGVTLKDYGGAGGLKTVSVRGFGAAHTTVVYDGITLTDSRSGEVDLSRYSLDNVGSLNLVIGDNDDIFIPARAASSVATLNISTNNLHRSQTDSTLLTARIRGGSFGYVSPFIKVGRNFSSGVTFNIIGEYIHADNDYPFTLYNQTVVTRERRNNSRMNSWHGEANIVIPTGTRSSLSSKIYYYDNNRRLPGPVIYYNNVSREALHERNAFAQTSYRVALSSKVSILSNAKFNWSESRYSDVAGKYEGGRLDQNYWQREAYASASVLYIPAAKFSAVYSADYSFNNLSSNLDTEVEPFRHSVLQSLTGRYKTNRLILTARALMSIYSNHAKRGDAAKDAYKLSPSFSASYQLLADRSIFVRASYKNIFRMPTFNESYFYHLGSTTLLPESTDQINIGLTWEKRPGGVLNDVLLTADIYHNRIKDKIVAIPYNMFVWQMMNIGRARTIGIDFTAAMTFNVGRRQQLLLNANYSYQNCTTRGNRESSEFGKQIAYIPENSGAASLAYENPIVNVVVHATAVGNRYSTNTHAKGTLIKSYAEAGAALYRTFPFRGHSFEVRADLMNIFDSQYEIVARYPMPGRSWQLSLKYTL